MAKAKVRKGEKMVCSPCGREVIIDNCGASQRTIWCCGKPMMKKTPAKKKTAGKKKTTSKKKK